MFSICHTRILIITYICFYSSICLIQKVNVLKNICSWKQILLENDKVFNNNENLSVYTRPFGNLGIDILILALALVSASAFKYKNSQLHIGNCF